MRILDEAGEEIRNPDLKLGYLTEENILIAHHERVEWVPEQWHYETVEEYPNGGKDVERVIDVPGVEEKEAWDEYETILRYVPYTQKELEKRNAPTLEERVGILEETSEDMILMMAELIGGN